MTITPFTACGGIAAPTSKSELHRLLICAALADQRTEIRCHGMNDDIRATARCLKALGARITPSDDGLSVVPAPKAAEDTQPQLDCGESGSTLRFLLPVAAARGAARFTGSGRLPQRPLGDLVRAMAEHGVCFSSDRLPLSIAGRMSGGQFHVPGNVSSQYITGLMLASPLIGGSRITVEGPLQSAGYVRMTAEAMETFGVEILWEGPDIRVRGPQRYVSPGTVSAQGDWSNAAFMLCLGALGGPVSVRGLKADSLQGDRRIADILRAAGARVTFEGDTCTVSRGRLDGLRLDVSDIPDLVPVLAALLMHAEGESAFEHAERLRLKESDRLETTCAMVRALGGEARVDGDTLRVRGQARCEGGCVDGAGDHRIVMAATVGASACAGRSRILGAEAVRKSWGEFFKAVQSIGGKTDVIDLRPAD